MTPEEKLKTKERIRQICDWYKLEPNFVLFRAVEKYYFYHSQKRSNRMGTIKNVLILEQDHKCFYCQKYLSNKWGTVDHKIPLQRGGTNIRSNLVAACAKCNNLKDNMTPEEFYEFQHSQLSLQDNVAVTLDSPKV